MTDYSFTLVDAPGVVAANNFISLFNPSSSTVIMSPLNVIIGTYDTGSAAAANSMQAFRTTAASGGSLITPSSVVRFSPGQADPQTQIRTGNPTVTTIGLAIAAFPPPFAGIPALGTTGVITVPMGALFVCPPGTGIVLATAAGATSQVWDLTIAWAEAP